MVRLEFLSKLLRKIDQKSLKVTILAVFLSLQRVTCWCHVRLKAHGNIYWKLSKVTPVNIPPAAPAN